MTAPKRFDLGIGRSARQPGGGASGGRADQAELSRRADEILAQLTIEEKIGLTGPRASGQPVAADRPANHPASTPVHTHRQAASTPGWITMTTTQSPSRGVQRWITVLDGNQLRRLRQQRGLSQEQLASQAGINLSAVTRLERQALGSCRRQTLARLAAALGEQPGALSPTGRPEPPVPDG